MSTWSRLLLAGLAIALAMAVLDGLWLGVLAKDAYAQGIGHLMAERPRWAAALAFYAVYPLGLMVFAVMPGSAAPGALLAAGRGALFGLFAYATYDLSNLATLRGWPVGLALLDIGWGIVISALSALAGKALLDRLPRG